MPCPSYLTLVLLLCPIHTSLGHAVLPNSSLTRVKLTSSSIPHLSSAQLIPHLGPPFLTHSHLPLVLVLCSALPAVLLFLTHTSPEACHLTQLVTFPSPDALPCSLLSLVLVLHLTHATSCMLLHLSYFTLVLPFCLNNAATLIPLLFPYHTLPLPK